MKSISRWFVIIIAYVIVVKCQEPTCTRGTLFATQIFDIIARGNHRQNIVISPAAMQISLYAASFLVNKTSASEIRQFLHFKTNDTAELAKCFEHFRDILQYIENFYMINSFYTNHMLPVNEWFKDAARFMDVKFEKISFDNPNSAVKYINKAVRVATKGKVSDMIGARPERETECMLVSGTAFDGVWQKGFSHKHTKRREFYVDGKSVRNVDTMSAMNEFKFGDLTKYDASAIELAYRETRYAMLIIMPNKYDGLRELEAKLVGVNILGLADSLKWTKLQLYIPKFAVNFKVDLKDLEKTNISTIFSNPDGNNTRISAVSSFTSDAPVNSAQFKAHVKVTELGEHASHNPNRFINYIKGIKEVHVDHPFIFVIKSTEAVILIGHVVK